MNEPGLIALSATGAALSSIVAIIDDDPLVRNSISLWLRASGHVTRSFAAGSDAEGGGHSLFKEGMTQSDPAIDSVLRLVVPKAKPTPELIERQKPKAILIATGSTRPPMHEQTFVPQIY